MLSYSLKPILALIPEATPLIKSAALTEDLPYDSRDSVLASALAIEYEKNLGSRHLPFDSMEKIAKAVELYELSDDVTKFSTLMVKRAQEAYAEDKYGEKAKFLQKQAEFESSFGNADPGRLHYLASTLVKEASDKGFESEVSSLTNTYGLQGMCLNKKACLEGLAARYQASREPAFLKVAESVMVIPVESFASGSPGLGVLMTGIANLDKQASLNEKGFDPFREMLSKQAELGSQMTVKLDGKDVPYESIVRLGKDRISAYVGADVADSLTDPCTSKQILETLPLDLQRILNNLIWNV